MSIVNELSEMATAIKGGNMKDNMFTKMVLFIAVILLFLNLIGFVYSPSSSYAAKSIQYKVVGSESTLSASVIVTV